MTNYIKNLKIVYFMTLISPILIIAIFSLATEKGTIMTNDNIDNIFRYMIPIFAVIFISIGFLLFKKRLKEITKEENADSKLLIYKGITIQRIAFIEGVAIFSAVAFLITMNNLYIAYTLIALSFYLPIYPTISKISTDLGIQGDNLTDKGIGSKRPNNFFGKNPWLIIPLIALMIFLNYNSLKDFFDNKVGLPDIVVDNGVIQDSIYHNDYLDWTYKIPSGYSVIPISELKQAEKKGNKYLDTKSKKSDKPIRLLNISNGLIDFMSNLNPRVLFPNLTSEEKYFEIIDDKLKNAKIESVTIKKQNQGVLQIDSLEFKFVEYSITGPNGRVGLMHISRFNQDFIFDISLTYRDTQEAIKFLNNLKTSNLNWE